VRIGCGVENDYNKKADGGGDNVDKGKDIGEDVESDEDSNDSDNSDDRSQQVERGVGGR